ncbi:MAG TPA: glycogen debranching N-terminal domain-containing protein [Methylomirabilota bacterium]|nr:glycogen debranching N-terminal domain-containing protein [Methylomirabilota bacterium]
MSSRPDVIAGEQYYILASEVAADLPKLVLKHDEAFLVADPRGDLPNVAGEFGFYVGGTRFLRQLELRLYDHRPIVLNAGVSEDALQASVDLTNPDVTLAPAVRLPGRSLRVARRVTVHGGQLYQLLLVEAFTREAHDLTLTLRFAADFVDVFEVRGHPRERRGTFLPSQVNGATVRLGYRGLDDITRTTTLTFTPPPQRLDETAAEFRVRLDPGASTEITVAVSAATEATPPPPRTLGYGEALRRRRAVVDGLEHDGVDVRCDHDLFAVWVARSRRDLRLLLTETAEGLVPYAGIPWYVAAFGRDALITAMQVLPFEPRIAAGTLRFLARHVGRRDDDFTEEEPGRIIHELRHGEMANCREIPFIPYYGTADAAPLFLMLLAEYWKWTADEAFLRALWPTAERVLGWMLRSADAHDGYLTYARRSPRGLVNQGWKDSNDAIMHASGDLAEAPIALCEVQGYQYAALLATADVAEALGDAQRPRALRERARRLRERFEADFWLPDQAYYALALDHDGRPCRVISSNPGHALWTHIVSDSRATIVARRLMSDDMFTGWGLRTLASGERLFNPMSYHNGSVWPHDTAIAAVGMRRYGLAEPSLTLITGLFEAVLQFENLRMPELFCGFARVDGYGPTHYPVACSPQAWAAGVVFMLISSMLGIVPDAVENQLTFNRPRLPAWLSWIELRGLGLRGSTMTVRASQGHDGAAIEMLARQGDAELVVRR